MYRTKVHLGLRTAKTALAVTLALTAAELVHSTMPIFSAIGAISAMSRTLGDALTACLTQLAGCVCGCVIGLLFLLVFPHMAPPLIGVGIVLVILLGIRLKIHFAIPLSCIVFVCICLNTTSGPLYYAASRFLDTSLGLLIALAVNMLIKPYNNRARIVQMITHFVQTFPDFLHERVLLGHYPDLKPLRRGLKRLEEEIQLYERQTFPHKHMRHEIGIYLRGCQQLAERMFDEINALCLMDSPGAPDEEAVRRLEKLGISDPDTVQIPASGQREEDIVLAYHLKNLLDAYDYLCEMNAASNADIMKD
ncbi:MAG: aromatic acid exporter family protein [Butyricicoccus sp.]|nr:aromatic acid exporter family protein [Butyricicoccus sp.]